MGWFLQANKKRKGTGKRRASKGSAPGATTFQWQAHHTRLVIRITAWFILLGGLVAAIFWGEPALRQYVASHRSGIKQVQLKHQPQWMSAPIAGHLRRVVAVRLAPDPFNHSSLAAAAAAMEASPWVNDVERIIRHPNGVVEVRASYRRPTAVVEARDGYHLVDDEGVRLPLTYGPDEIAALDLPVIEGIDDAPPHAGRIWTGGDLQAALQLAILLRRQAWADQVAAIDASNYAGRRFEHEPHLKLLTELDDDNDPRNNPGVRWGRAPGNEQFFEPPADVKLQHLRQVLRRYSTIDAGGQIVDVFGDNVLIQPTPPQRSELAVG